jgi:sugar transferase (PEP-CTERM/EpsH1 system associated)
LFLAHRVPYPPNRGDRIRSYHLLKYLAQRADIHLAFLSEQAVTAETQQVLARLCARVTSAQLYPYGRWLQGAGTLMSGKTATEGLYRSRAFKRQLAIWADETRFDAVVVFCSSMVQYLDLPGLDGVPTIVDLVDVDSQKWLDYADNAHGLKRHLYGLEGRRLRQLESSLPDMAAALTVVTDQEADLFESFRPDTRPHVLRNGVDLDYFQPQPSEPDTRPLTTVFIGALDYQANTDGIRWYCQTIWPTIRQRFPQALFRMVGSRPNVEARWLGDMDGVELVGEVPDVRPYLHDATVVVVPLRVARGVQNKVLEALAAGKPVVVTPPGREGIEATPGVHLVQAATSDEWTNAIGSLFDAPELCGQYGRAGRKFVEEHYRWSHQLEKLAELPGLRGCLERPHPTPVTPRTPQPLSPNRFRRCVD